jgi:hypothetical protein
VRQRAWIIEPVPEDFDSSLKGMLPFGVVGEGSYLSSAVEQKLSDPRA